MIPSEGEQWGRDEIYPDIMYYVLLLCIIIITIIIYIYIYI